MTAKLDEIGIGAARKSMLLFQTPTVVKVLRIVCLLYPQLGGQRNLGEIGIGAARKSMLLFQTQTVGKVLRIVGLSLIMLMCLQKMQHC